MAKFANPLQKLATAFVGLTPRLNESGSSKGRTTLMKKSRYTESQIVKILKEVEAGRKVSDVYREYDISDKIKKLGSVCLKLYLLSFSLFHAG